MAINSMYSFWRNNTQEEKEFLLSLCPFQKCIYYEYSNFKDYIAPLKSFFPQDTLTKDWLTDQWKKGLRRGLFIQIPGDFAFLALQPQWYFFLNQQLSLPEYTVFKQAITQSFLAYYLDMAQAMNGRIQSGQAVYFQEAMSILEYEHQSMMHAAEQAMSGPYNLAEYLHALDAFFSHKQRLEDWAHYLDRLLPLGKTSTSINQILLFDDIGRTQLKLNKHKEALKNFEKALKKCNALDKDLPALQQFMVALYTNLGIVVQNKEQQLFYQQEALKIAEKIDNIRQIGSVSYNLNESYFELHQLEESQFYLEKATAIFEHTGKFQEKINALQSHAAHYQLKQEWEKAEESLLVAMKIAEQFEAETLEGVLYQELASLYYSSGNFLKAQEACLQAIQKFIAIEEPRQTGNAYNLLSVMAFEASDIEVGLNYAEKALAAFHQADDKAQMAQTYVNIAIVLYQLEWYTECIKELEKGIDLYYTLQHNFSAFKARILLASTYCMIKEFEQAKQECFEILPYFYKKGETEELRNCAKVARLICETTKDQDFCNFFRRYIDDIELEE